jgi:hypothetical protein
MIMSSKFFVKPGVSSDTKHMFYIYEDGGSNGYLCKDGVIRGSAYMYNIHAEDSSYCETREQALDVIAKYEKTGKYKPKPARKKSVKVAPEFVYCRFKMADGATYIVKYKPDLNGQAYIVCDDYSYKGTDKRDGNRGYEYWTRSVGRFNFSEMHEFIKLRKCDLPKSLRS